MFGIKSSKEQVKQQTVEVTEIKDVDVTSEKFKLMRDDMSKLINTLDSLADALDSKHSDVKTTILDCKEGSSLLKTHKDSIYNYIKSVETKTDSTVTKIQEVISKIQETTGILDATTSSVKAIKESSQAISVNCGEIKDSVVDLGGIIDSSLKTLEATDIDFVKLIKSVEDIRKIANSTTEAIDSVNKLIINATIEASRAEEDSDKYRVVTKKISNLASESSTSNKTLLGILDSMIQLFEKANAGKQSYGTLDSSKKDCMDSIENSIISIAREVANINSSTQAVDETVNNVKVKFADVVTMLTEIITYLDSFKKDIKDNESTFEYVQEQLIKLDNSFSLAIKYLDILSSSIELVCIRIKGIKKLQSKVEEL